jgi:hypothetical protein
MATRLEPRAARTKRRALAMFGKGISGATPIAAKLTGRDHRQIGLQHVTQARATPWDCRSAIVGGAMVVTQRA